MEFKAKIFDFARSIDGKIRLTLEFDGDLAFDGKYAEVEKLIGKDLRATLKIWREKRSLDANAYCWALIGKIADAVRESKQDVYKDMLRHYGQSELVMLSSDVDVNGYFKHFDEQGKRYHNGTWYTVYTVYKGSSEFDSYEMSVLIDGVIHEAEQLGIPTITKREAERLVQRWR